MKRLSLIPTLCLAAAIGASPAARAGDCIVNALPVAPVTLADELEFGGGIPGQLNGVPFSVVSLEQSSLYWPGCGQDCSFRQYEGEAQCGDLVGTPVEYASLDLYPGTIDPSLISNVSATQTASGRWRVSAQGWVFPNTAPQSAAAGYTFELGTREVFDVTSSGGTDPLALDIGIRAGTWATLSLCDDDGFYRWNPSRLLRFQVTEQPAAGAPRTLVGPVFYDQFLLVDDVHPVEVTPGSTLTVDVHLGVSANATGAQDQFGKLCEGGFALLDMDPGFAFLNLDGGSAAYDGVQILVSPDPALTLVPRSGITYQTVPEPGALAGAAIALGALGLRIRFAPRST